MHGAPGRPRGSGSRRRVEGEDPELWQNPDLKACSVLVESERRMLWLPWWNATASPTRRRVFTERLADGSSREWQILGGPSGLPSAFDVQVYRALEWKLLDGDGSGDVVLSLRDVCERCCIKEVIALEPLYRRALQRLEDLRIRGPFGRGSGATTSTPGLIRAFARVSSPLVSYRANRIFEAERKIQLDPQFERSVRRQDLVAMNWETWTAAPTDLVRRLVEILSCLFSSSPGTAARIEGETLSQSMGFERGLSLAALERQLEAAHETLSTSSFLRRVAWDRPNRSVVYEPGVAARSVACRSGLLEPRRRELVEVEMEGMPRWSLPGANGKIRAV